MGILSGDAAETELIQVEKYNVAKSMNLIRIIDWQAQVILYTDTTRDGYTSVPFGETDISIDDAPPKVVDELNSDVWDNDGRRE